VNDSFARKMEQKAKTVDHKEQIACGLVHAIGYALEEGLDFEDFVRLAEDVWPEMVQNYSRHLVNRIYKEAKKQEK
tara:strand:+ start:531 stop:758 length:228 start_codon:yes stop_codon:yes gene_type:complete